MRIVKRCIICKRLIWFKKCNVCSKDCWIKALHSFWDFMDIQIYGNILWREQQNKKGGEDE